MEVKKHYDKHLSGFYGWMSGDFETNVKENIDLFVSYNIRGSTAIDLGCGHGIQSVALARLGFNVTAVDFSGPMLAELENRSESSNIRTVHDDILSFLLSFSGQVHLITCVGDTITHLPSVAQVAETLQLAADRLESGGKLILSFRDLTRELVNEERFISVKSDDRRIMTCFLEYFNDHVMVHDLVWEQGESRWVQKISAYPKLRLSADDVRSHVEATGLTVTHQAKFKGMELMIAEKFTR